MTAYCKSALAVILSFSAFHVPKAWALPEVVVEIKNHLFYPQDVVVPAGKKVRLTFINFDSTPEEIDSFALNREKVIFANSKGTIFIGPLSPGEYPFFGEFHPNSAVGKVVVKSATESANVN
ncbi:cupredoxin domain-containing protein [Alteromonas sp. D210916BOD_24]|uniref:cupredoxin domain-containing protein n=1 Tax=Alteromonas sp. D210916BOD_24 TaxID=3157618 RepID=UPI00399D0DDE